MNPPFRVETIQEVGESFVRVRVIHESTPGVRHSFDLSSIDAEELARALLNGSALAKSLETTGVFPPHDSTVKGFPVYVGYRGPACQSIEPGSNRQCCLAEGHGGTHINDYRDWTTP